ncbi:hypothetical protein K4K53_012178 [Colletotrichum sp. SAR 10_77]|nr:hypothetical protein K4K53_012178 [Colletotrichum sp. SAR 10_77]
MANSDVEKYDETLNLGLTEEPKKPNGFDVTPTFEAGVQVKAEIDANVGDQIGTGSYTAGRTLISAQITAFMTGILQFIATGTISTSTGRFDYIYGSYFYYQLEFKAKATVLDWANWALKDQLAYAPDPRKYTIYKSSGSIDLHRNRKRMVRLIDQPESEDDMGQSYANDTLAETALLAPMCLFKRQDDDSMDLEPQLTQLTQQIQCPAGDSPSMKLPKLRSFMHSAVGYSGSLMKLECNEFPWASSEEGGNFRATNERSQECVPSVQNGLGGQCIGMMNYMTQNVGKMDPDTDPDECDDLWIGWFQGSNTDSMKRTSPFPVGYDPVNWNGQPADKSWTFKRNYTFSVINDGSQASNWWDATGKQFTTNTGYTFRDPNGFSSLICAVNIFDQDDYYRNPRQGNAAEFNGLCYRGDSYAANGWAGSYRYSRCKIDFGAAVTKRSEDDAAGEKDEWEITGKVSFVCTDTVKHQF